MTAEKARRDLEAAVAAGGSDALRAALPLVGATDPAAPEHRAAVRGFLTSFAHAASLETVDIEAAASALRHAGNSAGAGDGAELQFLDLCRTLLDRALAIGNRELALAAAAAVAESDLLSETNRVMLVVFFLRHRHPAPPGSELSGAFQSPPARAALLLALEQTHGTLEVAAMADPETIRAAADWALSHAPDAVWAQKTKVVALIRSGEPGAALEAACRIAGDPEVPVLYAWALFGLRRFSEAAGCMRSVRGNSPFVRALKAVVLAAGAFDGSLTSTLPADDLADDLLDEITRSGSCVQLFGPPALFGTGAWLARAGRLQEAIGFARQAAADDPSARYCYGAAQLMQLAGRWDAAGSCIESAPRESVAVACLALIQSCHEEGTAGLSRTAGDPLIGARSSIVWGEPCEYLAFVEGSPREVAEETLRINLTLAVGKRDLVRLNAFMQEPLFSLFPAPEVGFHQGVGLWIAGNRAEGKVRLRRALELSPEYGPAVQALAALVAEEGDHAAAGALWDKAVRLCPADGNALVRRAIEFAAAGDASKGIASLRAYCARVLEDNTAHYWLARLQFTAMLRRTAQHADEWFAVEQQAKAAASSFRRAAPGPEVAWFLWACGVLQVKPDSWQVRAGELLAAEPGDAGPPAPVEARWLGGLLRTLTAGFDAGFAGLRMLAAACLHRPGAAAIAQLAAAAWRLSEQVQNAQQAREFCECLLTLASVVPEVTPPVDFLAARFAIEVGNGAPVSLSGRIRSALAARDTAVLQNFLEQAGPSPEESLRLPAAIAALEVRAFPAFQGLADAAPSDPNWDLLRAIAMARQNHKDAFGTLCALLDATVSGRKSLSGIPDAAGLLALLGAKCRKHERDRLIASLTAIPEETSLRDDDIAVSFLRVSALMDRFSDVARLVARSPARLTPAVRQVLTWARCHEVATATKGGHFARAAELAREVSAEVDPETQRLIAGVLQRAEVLRDSGTLLAALAPTPAFHANHARFAGLTGLLNALREAVPRHPLNLKGRDDLRKRLGECRRRLETDEWHAHFRSLAILHWEWGLAAMKMDPPLAEESIECFRFAHYLWHHLLTHERFLAAFADDRLGVEALRDRIETEILDGHRDMAHLHLEASDPEGCRFHLSCLQDWNQPAHAQFLTAASVKPRPSEGFSESLLAGLRERSSVSFDRWVDGVLSRARRNRDDPAAHERLEAGIRKDYETAIRVASEALEVVPDQRRLAMFVVEQCADWVYDLYAAERSEEGPRVLEPALTMARQVANSEFRPGRLDGPDGQLICRIFDYAWKLETRSSPKRDLLREYVRWNPSDVEARETLEKLEGFGRAVTHERTGS